MDNRNIKIRYCASVLSIPKKIIECGPLIVKNYKIKCDNNFEPFWYKIHIDNDVEKIRKIEKDILMNKYGTDDFVYNTSNEQYYKEYYDDEIYMSYDGNITNNNIKCNDNEIYPSQYENITNDNIIFNNDDINDIWDKNYDIHNNNKLNIQLYVPILKSPNITQKDKFIDNDNIENKKKKIYNKKNIFTMESYFYDDSDNDSYDNWSSPIISDEDKIEDKTDDKTNNKKNDKKIDIIDYDDYDDYY